MRRFLALAAWAFLAVAVGCSGPKSVTPTDDVKGRGDVKAQPLPAPPGGKLPTGK